MNDNEVMAIILKHLIADASNKEYRNKLNIILQGIEGQRHIEERKHPRYQSIVLFGINIFPFTMKQYRDMVEEIIKNDC